MPTLIFYKCRSNYALTKTHRGKWLEDLWRREKPDSPELIGNNDPLSYDRQSLY